MDNPAERKAATLFDARKSTWKKNNTIISTMEKDSIKTSISLHISQSAVRDSHRKSEAVSHRKLKFIHSYVHRPVFVSKL